MHLDSESQKPSHSNIVRKRILVVDDEPDLAELIGLEFQLLGATVERAYSTPEALNVLRLQTFDIVISDIRMPGGDGPDIIQYFRRQNTDCPVVLMSGFSELSNEETFRLGAVAKLQKPFDRRDLIRIVDKACTPIDRRWNKKPSTTASSSYELFLDEDAEPKQSNFLLGKGGAFVAHQGVMPKVEDLVQLRLSSKYLDGYLVLGVVRWVWQIPQQRTGFGVEFVYLGEDGRAHFIDKIKALHSYEFIPVPR